MSGCVCVAVILLGNIIPRLHYAVPPTSNTSKFSCQLVCHAFFCHRFHWYYNCTYSGAHTHTHMGVKFSAMPTNSLPVAATPAWPSFFAICVALRLILSFNCLSGVQSVGVGEGIDVNVVRHCIAHASNNYNNNNNALSFLQHCNKFGCCKW